MDSARKFKNSWARAQRARLHLASFKVEWERVFANHGITTTTRYDQDSAWFIASMVVPDSTVERFAENTLSLEIGEYGYQLRAALDGLIWDAITFTQGTEPSADANRIEFPVIIPPITNKSRKFEDCAFLDFPFPDDLKMWLDSIQPYHPVKPEGHPDRGLETVIWDVHDLARFDRHRRLRVVAPVITQLRFGIASDPESQIVASERIETFDLFGGQYEFLRFRAETADGNAPTSMALKTALAFEAILEDIRPFNDTPDMGTHMANYIFAVEYIINRFESAFS